MLHEAIQKIKAARFYGPRCNVDVDICSLGVICFAVANDFDMLSMVSYVCLLFFVCLLF